MSERDITYRSWESMVRRVTNPKHSCYGRYSKLGMFIPWLTYKNFARDMGKRPSRDYSIDRIDNEKGYFPGNVRWATRTTQQRNRRGNVLVTVGAETLTVAEWSERTGLGHSTIIERLRRGWSDEDALSSDLHRHRVPRKRPTHCKHGHRFTPENTYVKPKNGRWTCRACQRKGGYPSRR